MTPSALLHLSLLRWVFAGLREAGASDADVTRETGWVAVDDPDAMVPCATATALIDGAIRLTGDPAFGLHAAKAVQMRGLGPALGCCCAMTRTTSELFKHAGRYLHLHGSAMGLQVEALETGTVVRLVFSPPSLDRSARAATEFALGSLALAVLEASESPGILKAVHFRHAAPSFRAEYDTLFQCPVKFSAGAYQLELEAEPPARRLRVQAELPEWVATQSDEVMSRLPVVGPVSTNVRRFLVSQFPWGIPTMTQTAVGVQESVQGLYERLLPEGTAFARIREELLNELACAYLRDRVLSTPEVAHLLGFIELQVFEQTFGRWSGMSVRDYRASVAKG